MEPFRVRVTGSSSGTLEAVKVTAELIHFAVETDPPQNAPPSSPENVTATEGDGQVVVSWDPAVFGSPDGYRIYRSETDDFDTATLISGDLDASTGTFTDTTAEVGTTYYYWVVAFNAEGESDPAATGPATPTAALSLSDLSDVDTAGAEDGDWLFFNAGDDQWEPGAPT